MKPTQGEHDPKVSPSAKKVKAEGAGEPASTKYNEDDIILFETLAKSTNQDMIGSFIESVKSQHQTSTDPGGDSEHKDHDGASPLPHEPVDLAPGLLSPDSDASFLESFATLSKSDALTRSADIHPTAEGVESIDLTTEDSGAKGNKGNAKKRGRPSKKTREPKDSGQVDTTTSPPAGGEDDNDDGEDDGNDEGDTGAARPKKASRGGARLSLTPKPPVGSEEWHRLRRENHKEVERRRRETINEGINELMLLLPSPPKNKGKIVHQAALYIRQLKENEATNVEKWTLEKLLTEQAINELSAQVDMLKAENEQLRLKLEKASSAGGSGEGSASGKKRKTSVS
ncbi:basic helix-loop-helix protein [Dimargaris verticillata]|uniref:Basic helix-loop-helix protein n=1 Tax=Dimargaris verticillata TaxID=2761393 RepID=A0A9W8B2N4_9FUNG|nr:basic helix-loop-helix protein [Dimargaris verticillata]